MEGTSIHTNLISDAQILVKDISEQWSDSIEKGQNRLASRIGAIAIGTASYGLGWDFPFLLFPMLFDSLADTEKLRKIKEKIEYLNSAKLDISSPDYGKVIKAIDVQKQIYGNIEEYTKNAQQIKLIAALGCILGWVGGKAVIKNQSRPESIVVLGGTVILVAGMLIALPASLVNLGHWMFKGPELRHTNKKIASAAMEVLNTNANSHSDEFLTTGKVGPIPLN